MLKQWSTFINNNLRVLSKTIVNTFPDQNHLLEWIISSSLLNCTHYCHANPVQERHRQQCHGEECYNTQERVHGQ